MIYEFFSFCKSSIQSKTYLNAKFKFYFNLLKFTVCVVNSVVEVTSVDVELPMVEELSVDTI